MQHIFSWTLKVSLFSPSQLVYNGKGEKLIIFTPQWRPARIFVNKIRGSNKVCMTFFLIVGKHHHHMYNSLVFHLLESCGVCSQCCPLISPWSEGALWWTFSQYASVAAPQYVCSMLGSFHKKNHNGATYPESVCKQPPQTNSPNLLSKFNMLPF